MLERLAPIWLVLVAGAVVLAVWVRRLRRLPDQPVAEESAGQVLESMSGVTLMRYSESVNKMGLAPVGFVVKLLWGFVAGLLVMVWLESEPPPPYDMLYIAVMLSVAIIGVPIGFMVGLRRTRRMELRCPKCRALIVGFSQGSTYEQVRKTGACPKCGEVVLRKSTMADTAVAT